MNTGVLLQVPPFPPVATKLLRLPSDDFTGAAAVLPLLRADPALSAEIIRSSNSALFGLQTQVIYESAAPVNRVLKLFRRR